MKMPNGYGSIYKIRKKVRNPFIVRITVGYDMDENTGRVKEIRQQIGAYSSREDALLALADYHQKKNILRMSSITFKELFEEWKIQNYMKYTESTIYCYDHAFDLCVDIQGMKMRDLHLCDLQKVIDTCDKNYPTLKTIQNLFSKLFKFASIHDIVLKDYSIGVDIYKYKDKNPNSQKRERFSDDQIEEIWNISKTKFDAIILMLMYSGVRITELLNLKKEDIFLDDQYFEVRKSKTKNGVRPVPIADKILPYFKEWYFDSESCEYLLHDDSGNHLSYNFYVNHYYAPIKKKLNVNLTPHCCRHTLISKLAECSVDPTYIKLIVGHSGAMSMTERVYTHISIDRLIEAVNMI